MVGMLQIMTYLLCVYLIYKGFEIFQIGLVADRDHRVLALSIGVLAVLIALVVAGLFVYLIDQQAAKVGQTSR